jgi:hypothetical protein
MAMALRVVRPTIIQRILKLETDVGNNTVPTCQGGAS